MAKELINRLLNTLAAEEQRYRHGLGRMLDRAAQLDDDDEDSATDGEDGESRGASPVALTEVLEFVRIVRRLTEVSSVREIHKWFGAPGNWGYETPIGDALSKLYNGATWEPQPDPIAQAVEAERVAIRAEIESRSADAQRANGEPSTRGFAAGFEARVFDSLLAWLDARSKAEASR